MKKFTIPCRFGETTAPFALYVGEPADGAHPLWAQSHWLRDERGGEVPAEVLDSFQKLLDIAREQGVSFEELCVYTFDSETATVSDD